MSSASVSSENSGEFCSSCSSLMGWLPHRLLYLSSHDVRIASLMTSTSCCTYLLGLRPYRVISLSAMVRTAAQRLPLAICRRSEAADAAVSCDVADALDRNRI